jgi:hypothetical protein
MLNGEIGVSQVGLCGQSSKLTHASPVAAMYYLGMAILLEYKVVLGEIIDDLAVLITHAGQHVDHFDVGGKCRRSGLLLLLLRERWQSGREQ